MNNSIARLLVGTAAALVAVVPASAAYADEPEPMHGTGGTSNTCFDGEVPEPGTGAETGGLGRVPFLSVGGQAGEQIVIGHVAYVDICLAIARFRNTHREIKPWVTLPM